MQVVRHSDQFSGSPVVPPPGRFHGNHAIVIGASISGLLAARVLSAHFDRVTVFDRDALPSASGNRRAVPQGHHGHGLLASGLRGLKTLFPGIERDLLEAGAVPGDVIGSIRWFQHGRYKAKFASGLEGVLLQPAAARGDVAPASDEAAERAHRRSQPHRRAPGGSRGRGRRSRAARRSEDPSSCARSRRRRRRQRLRVRPSGSSRSATPGPRSKRSTSASATRRACSRRLPHDLDGDIGVILAPKPPQREAHRVHAGDGGRLLDGHAGRLARQPRADRSRRISRVRAHAGASGHLRRHQARASR